MISIEEITRDGIEHYWQIHFEYLMRDIFPYSTLGEPIDEEDIEYFESREYRDVIEKYMDREPDKAHLIYFCRDNARIGCAQYVTYKSEDGKCFLMEFWVFPEFRGEGTGHDCYAALAEYVKADGAGYFEINVSNERNRNFWLDIGFTDDGVDEYEQPLMKLVF